MPVGRRINIPFTDGPDSTLSRWRSLTTDHADHRGVETTAWPIQGPFLSGYHLITIACQPITKSHTVIGDVVHVIG
jgi:hypothetical protein